MLLPAIRLRYRLLRRKFPSWFRPGLALIMVGAAILGAGAAYWAAEAEEESIILKQRLVAGRLVEVAAWAKYAHQYATWSALYSEDAEHTNLGRRLSRTADSVRDADTTEARLLDLQAQEEFARARIYRTFYHFLKRPRDKSSIVESLSSDVSADLARFGFGVNNETSQAAADTSHTPHKAASGASLAPDLELKFWQVLDERVDEVHGRVLLYSLSVVLFVSALAIFTFADLSSHSFHRSTALAGIGLLIVIGTAAFAIWIDTSFLAVVAATCLLGMVIVWWAATRGLLQSEASEGEPLHAHEVEGKSYWGASLFLRRTHDAQSRLAVTLIAMTVFLSSLVSYLYVEAATTREKLSHEALKYQVAFGKSSTTSVSTAIAGALQPTINLLAKQVHCAAATQQEMFPWSGAQKQVSEFGGVGLDLAMERGRPRVAAVREDGAAAAAGVRTGDLIVEIDGAYTTAMPMEVIVNRLRGRIGTVVELRISRDGAVLPTSLNLTRRKIVVEAQISIQEDSATLIRNRRIACEELNTQQAIRRDEELRRVGYDGGLAPGQDLYYRTVYSSLSGNPARLYALADGYEELAALWNRRATVYLASLTLFAIALYLFGQALGVGHIWQARTFLGCGSVLVVLSFGWTLVTWGKVSERPSEIPAHCTNGLQTNASTPAERSVETAAYQYGQGEALFYLADTPADYRKAADALDCAVAARPNFARAHSLRTSAFESMDSSSRWDTYLPASSWSRTRDVIAARTQTLKAFQRNNVTPSWIASSNAFDELALALIEGDRAALASSLQVYAARVASLQPDKKAAGAHAQENAGTSNSSLHMNYGLALLADNRPREAETNYKHAIEGLRTAKDMRALVEGLADLKMLTTNCTNLNTAQTCAELERSVRRIKESLVAGEWREEPGDTRAALSDVSIQITPSSAGWRARLDANAAKDQRKMTVVWYMLDTASADGRPDGMKLWRAIHGLSRTIEVASLKPDADGTVELAIPYMKEQSRCLAEGAYVPEIYIDGVLVSPADLPAASLKRSEFYRSRYMNLMMCHPAGWTLTTGVWQLPMRFFDDEQKRPSAMLFTFYAPRGATAEELRKEYLNTAFIYLLKLMPASLEDARAWAGALYAFEGCNVTAPKGIAHREWVTSEGFVHVAIVHLWIPREDACQVLNSLDNYFAPNSLSGGR